MPANNNREQAEDKSGNDKLTVPTSEPAKNLEIPETETTPEKIDATREEDEDRMRAEVIEKRQKELEKMQNTSDGVEEVPGLTEWEESKDEQRPMTQFGEGLAEVTDDLRNEVPNQTETEVDFVDN